MASASAGEGGGRAVTWKVEEGREGGMVMSVQFNAGGAVGRFGGGGGGGHLSVGRPIEVRTPSYALIARMHVCVCEE